MADTYYCPRCHNDTFHFSAELHDEVCDSCGTPKNQARTQTLKYEHDRDKQRAIAYIKAMDYASAIPFLNSMKNRFPDDSNIYFLHLMGITNRCKDYLLNADKNVLNNASKNWEILCALDADTSFFSSYIINRKHMLLDEQEKIINKASYQLMALFGGLILSLLLIAFQLYIFILGAVGSIVGIVCLDLFGKLFRAIKRKKKIENSNNPFI